MNKQYVARITFSSDISNIYNSINVKQESELIYKCELDKVLKELKRDGYKIINVEESIYTK